MEKSIRVSTRDSLPGHHVVKEVSLVEAFGRAGETNPLSLFSNLAERTGIISRIPTEDFQKYAILGAGAYSNQHGTFAYGTLCEVEPEDP